MAALAIKPAGFRDQLAAAISRRSFEVERGSASPHGVTHQGNGFVLRHQDYSVSEEVQGVLRVVSAGLLLMLMSAPLPALPQSTEQQTIQPQTAPLQPVPLQSSSPQPVLQKPAPQQPTVSVEVKVVNVYATVRKKKGEIVSDLTKDDFALEEDGRPQKISYFSRESELPLDLGLLVDTSMSQRRVLGQERSASESLIDQVLRVGKDKAFVIHFDREVELLQDLTSSREKLQAAIGVLGAPDGLARPRRLAIAEPRRRLKAAGFQGWRHAALRFYISRFE